MDTEKYYYDLVCCIVAVVFQYRDINLSHIEMIYILVFFGVYVRRKYCDVFAEFMKRA